MKPETRNVVLAVVLSMVVLMGWQFFYVIPQQMRTQQAAEIAAQNAASQTPGVATPSTAGDVALPTGTAPATTTVADTTTSPNDGTYADRAAALAATPDRVAISTDKLKGSIN